MVSSPLPEEPEEKEALRESILTYIHDLLKNNGPQPCTGPMAWLRLAPDTERLLGGRQNIIEFLLGDEQLRFRTYKDKYICIQDDLAKAIRMSDAEQTPCQIIDVEGDSLGTYNVSTSTILSKIQFYFSPAHSKLTNRYLLVPSIAV